MYFRNPYLTLHEKMELLQKWILVHSVIYYKYNRSIVSDGDYDNNSKQLLKLKAECPQSYRRTKYFYVMNDFDGSTGFDLPDRLNSDDDVKIHTICRGILREVKRC